MKNAADTKLVRDLAKCRCFSRALLENLISIRAAVSAGFRGDETEYHKLIWKAIFSRIKKYDRLCVFGGECAGQRDREITGREKL